MARLSGVRLTEREVGRLAGEMAAILAHFDALAEGTEVREGRSELPERGLPPRSRADEPGSDSLCRPIEEMAPDWRERHFVVPRLPGMLAARSDEPEREGPEEVGPAPQPPSTQRAGEESDGCGSEA